MRILHCCLANFYIDGFSYQENILPRVHKNLGHDVEILASTETYVTKTKLGYVEPRSYCNEDDIRVTRIPYSKLLPHSVMRKLRLYKGVKEKLEGFKPDIIFLHDFQFLDVKYIVRYAEENPKVKVYADCHTDFVNSARNWVSKNILHKIIYKRCAKKVEPYTTKFFGTLPARSDFLKEVYNIPAEKIELLPFGAEDDKIDWGAKDDIRRNVRKDLCLSEADFVIISGGKLDKRKNIHLLMKAIREIDINRVKLVLFGIPDSEMKEEVEQLAQHESIRYVGWLNSEQIYNYFLASDLAVFPGTHSVLWEQATGSGLPGIFKRWKGFEHIDLGGNCLFLETDSVKDLKNKINRVFVNTELFQHMKQTAFLKGVPHFAYAEIAKKAIDQ